MIALIVGLFLILLGGVFLIVGLVATKRAKTAQSWPSIPGTVNRTDVVEHEDSDSDGFTSVTYEPVVEYNYAVMGQPFTSKRIAFGTNRYNYKKAQEIVSKYPAGARVNVFYNPEKPKDAVLETVAAGGKLLTILGLVLGAAGLVTMVVSLLV